MNTSNAKTNGPDVRDAAAANSHLMTTLALLEFLWSAKWRILATVLVLCAIGVGYSILAKPWYRATVVLVPQPDGNDAGLNSRLLQFAGQIGIGGLALGASHQSEPLAVLKSQDFARGFIEERDLVPVLLPYDGAPIWKRWFALEDDGPDIRDAVDYFTQEILDVDQNPKTDLITISVTWLDARLAAEWANELASRINRNMRDRALAESQRNIAYLRGQLKSTELVEMQLSIGRALDVELQRLMLANGKDDFSYRVIDSAHIPKRPHHPRAMVLVAACALLGLVTGSLAVILRDMLRRGITAS